MAFEKDEDPIYVCQVCGYEDDPDKFGKYCPACGTDLDELEAKLESAPSDEI